MRVIYLVSLFPCWSETFIVREIQALIRQGVDVRIVSLKHPCEEMIQSDARALLDRVTYPVANLTTAWRVLKTSLRHPLHALGELFMLARCLGRRPESLAKSLVVWWRTLGLLDEISRLQPDHLHAHWATYPSTAAMWLSRRIDIPFSFTAHAHDIFLEDHLLGPKLRSAAFAVTISDFNRRFLVEQRQLPQAAQMHVIHCGVMPQSFAFEPNDRDPQLLMAVGRLDEIKGFTHLIDACALLSQRGMHFRCDIIGEGPLRAELSKQIDQLGLSQQVRLLGARKQEDVRESLYRACVFVLPSVVTATGDRDGIPVALMEAMSAGLPVVSTQVSGIPELVIDGQTGLCAAPRDAEHLSRCIQTLLENPALRVKLAHNARKLVEEQFDIDTEARKLHDAFT